MDDSDPDRLERLRPLNLYGQSKQWMDLYAWRQGWLDRIVGLKYFNVFGPNENHKGDMRSVVCKSYAQVLETGAIRLFKSYSPQYRDGEQDRDFLYVKDAVAMTLHLAENPAANGIFNIGSGKKHTSGGNLVSNMWKCRNPSARNTNIRRRRTYGSYLPADTTSQSLPWKTRCGITW
jgi:ADP-L-glycero-D-manno-heptose 6-epimerase